MWYFEDTQIHLLYNRCWRLRKHSTAEPQLINSLPRKGPKRVFISSYFLFYYVLLLILIIVLCYCGCATFPVQDLIKLISSYLVVLTARLTMKHFCSKNHESSNDTGRSRYSRLLMQRGAWIDFHISGRNNSHFHSDFIRVLIVCLNRELLGFPKGENNVNM